MNLISYGLVVQARECMEEFTLGSSFDKRVCLAIDISDGQLRVFRNVIPQSHVIRNRFELFGDTRKHCVDLHWRQERADLEENLQGEINEILAWSFLLCRLGRLDALRAYLVYRLHAANLVR